MHMNSTFSRRAINIQSREALTDEQLQSLAPSLFKDVAHESRSAKFQCIPTHQIIQGMRQEGFQPFSVVQGGSRIEGKADFTKHMVRFRHDSVKADGEAAHEIILINAHDGTSAYKLFSGVFRFVCQNGLIAGENIQEFRIGHTGKALDNVIEGSYRILDNVALVDARMQEMQSLTLNDTQQDAYAKAALVLKYDSLEESPIKSQQLLRPRRWEDKQQDVWSVFNRVQENLMRGGQSYVTDRGRLNSTRAVKNIQENTKLNRALWTLAEAMVDRLS